MPLGLPLGHSHAHAGPGLRAWSTRFIALSRAAAIVRRSRAARKYSATYAILGGMADRERWEIDLRCPQCGLRGHARISQNHPLVGSDDAQTVDGLTAGFKVIAHKLSQNSEIHCSSCNVEAKRI